MNSSFVSHAPVRFFASATQCSYGCEHRLELGQCAYRVAWEINPHMRVGSVNSRRAARQHCVLVDTLERLGAQVDILPFVHAAYDSVFVKDSAILVRGGTGERALVTHPHHRVRKAEQPARSAAIEGHGFELVSPPAATLEGGDVVVRPDGTGAYMGYGFRSSRASAPTLERFLEVPVTPLELRDPQLYHLDMVLSVLRDGTVLLCKDALTPQSVRDLERTTNASSLVCVSIEEARRFAVNLIEVRNHLVSASPSPRVHAQLCERGFVVNLVRLDEFHAAGGSAACLVARVHDGDAALPSVCGRTPAVGSSAA